MSSSLPGSAVLVTGAARGIGRAIAEHLAKNGAKAPGPFNQLFAALPLVLVFLFSFVGEGGEGSAARFD